MIFIDGVDVVEVDAGGWPIVILTPDCCHNVTQSGLVLQPSSSPVQMNFGRFVGLGYIQHITELHHCTNTSTPLMLNSWFHSPQGQFGVGTMAMSGNELSLSDQFSQ